MWEVGGSSGFCVALCVTPEHPDFPRTQCVQKVWGMSGHKQLRTFTCCPAFLCKIVEKAGV